jgi:cytidine deaminase
MTILEELIETGFRICENSRGTHQSNESRAAVLLSKVGKTYFGTDAKLSPNDTQMVCAERAAFLSAIADGASTFEVRILFHVTLLC